MSSLNDEWKEFIKKEIPSVVVADDDSLRIRGDESRSLYEWNQGKIQLMYPSIKHIALDDEVEVRLEMSPYVWGGKGC